MDLPDATENTLVHASFFNQEGTRCECIGVRMNEEKSGVRIAFNAVEDAVIDAVEIPRSKLLNIEIVDLMSLKTLE